MRESTKHDLIRLKEQMLNYLMITNSSVGIVVINGFNKDYSIIEFETMPLVIFMETNTFIHYIKNNYLAKFILEMRNKVAHRGA